jgi:hypothetical protein
MRLASFTAIATVLQEAGVRYLIAGGMAVNAQYARALVKEVYGTVAVHFVSLPTLIEMKRAVGRPQDLIDVENLNERVRDLG